MNRRFAFLVATMVVCSFAGLLARDEGTATKPKETESFRLRVETDLMQVHAVVTDQDGRIEAAGVRGLHQAGAEVDV